MATAVTQRSDGWEKPNKNPTDMRNISENTKCYNVLLTLQCLLRKHWFVSGILKKNHVTFPKEQVRTVLTFKYLRITLARQTNKWSSHAMALAGY